MDASGYPVQQTAEARVEEAAIEAAKAARLRYVTGRKPGYHAPSHRRFLQLPRYGGEGDPRRGDARPHPLAGDPAGVDRRLDLPRRRRPPPGGRARRARPQAVPLPPALARGARRDEVRADDRLRPARCPQIRARVDERPGKPGPAAREGAGDRRAAAGDDAHPRRQRRVREAEQLLRPDHAARPPREGRAAARSASSFRGKSGVEHEIDVDDPRLAQIVQQCQDLPGPGAVPVPRRRRATSRDVGSGDVNDYLREITGEEFTAKDFRTWAGTVLAAPALQEFEAFDSQAQAKKNIVAADRVGGRRSSATPGRLPEVLHPPGRPRQLPRRQSRSRLCAAHGEEMQEKPRRHEAGGGGGAGFLERRLRLAGAVTASSEKPRRAARPGAEKSSSTLK